MNNEVLINTGPHKQQQRTDNRQYNKTNRRTRANTRKRIKKMIKQQQPQQTIKLIISTDKGNDNVKQING